MDANIAKHLKFKYRQRADHSQSDAFKDTTNNVAQRQFRLMSSNSNRSDNSKQKSQNQLKVKKFRSSVVNQNENQFQPSLKKYKSHKQNQSSSQCPHKDRQFRNKCGSSISSDCSKNSRGSSFSQSYQNKIKPSNWRKYLTNKTDDQNKKQYRPKIKPYQSNTKYEGEKLRTVPQMRWQRKQTPGFVNMDSSNNIEFQPERHEMHFIEGKNIEIDNSLKLGNQQSSNNRGSVSSFYMQSQEKTHAQLNIHDPILEEEDELICLENAEDLKIDDSYKSPDVKQRDKDQKFDIKLNFNGGLDSANLCTQIGAENVEAKGVSEVREFDSDKIADAQTVIGQKQVELKPTQVLKHASQFELSDLDQDLEIVKSGQHHKSNNLSGDSQNSRNSTANMPYHSMNMNSVKRTNQTLPTLYNNYTQLTQADQKLYTQNEGQFQNIQNNFQQADLDKEPDYCDNDQLQLSSKQKSTTWRDEQNLKVQIGQELQVESKFQKLNLEDPVAILKSPKGEKNLNWIDLVQDAVCMNDDDEEPFQPVAYQSKIDQNNDMIIVNKIDPLKKESSKNLSCSEGLTDGGESPNKLKTSDYLKVEKKHHYDPHEPHSAQTRQLESLKFKDESLSPDSIPNNMKGQQKQFKNINIECEAIDEESQNQLGTRQSYPDQDLAILACEDEVIFAQDLSDDGEGQVNKNTEKQINMNNQNTDRQEKLIDRNNEEADLVEDGFFENLMKNQAIKNQEGSNELYKNYGSLENTAQSIPGQPTGPEFSQFLHEKQDQTWSPIGQSLPQKQDKIPKNINKQIYQEVKASYFPQMTSKFEIFQGMLKKEQIILQRIRHERLQNQSLFERQTELTPDMRLTLLDWLCQVSTDYCLKRQTYHLALQYTDYYLQHCQQHIQTSEFQLIGVTCLHMAAKFEEIYPPGIKQFAESTNDSVTTEQIIQTEFKICNVLEWNFDQFQTTFIWASWFMKRWDEYVDESLSYLKQQFQLKFLEGTPESHYKFMTFMQFVDILSMSYNSKQYTPREMVACVMYLLIGGKDIMCAFQFEYREMYQVFQEQFPIIHPEDLNSNQGQRLPEGILFYNQIIQPFFNNEFGYYLHDLIEPLKFVLRFFTLDVSGENSQASNGLIQQCKFIMHQQNDMAIERIKQAQEEGYLPNIKILPNPYANYEDYTDQEVFNNVSEFFSFQTYNPQNLDTIKFLQTIPEEKPQRNNLLSPTNEVSHHGISMDTSSQLQQADMYDLSQPRVISVTSENSFN